MDDDTALAAVEQAMTAIRRRQRRRALKRLAESDGGAGDIPLDPAVFDVIDAVAGAPPVTATGLGALLGTDQPHASRLAARATAAGMLNREPDPGDGRRVLLVLTPQGRAALGAVRETRTSYFADAMTTWSAAERREFARLLTSFVAALQQREE